MEVTIYPHTVPDATRPTSSMFFKVVKSVLSFDGSLNRIRSHPGGKNFNLIFTYITSLAYDRTMHVTGNSGKTGVEVFQKTEWLSPADWLRAMEWGLEEGRVSSHAEFAVRELFNSFHQDDVFDVEGDYPALRYKFKQELDYPTQEQIETARKSNKYFMMAIDDLIGYLTDSLISGKPEASRRRATFLPLWEALLSDPLTDVFREELLYQVNQNLDKVSPGAEELSILEIATGTGSGTVRLIRDLIASRENCTITIHCYDEIGNQLNRARERISSYDKKMKATYTAKNLKFNYEFIVKRFKDPIRIDTDTLDLIVTFQNLHYIDRGDRYSYFENVNRMIKEQGLVFMAQTTAYSKMFPHPLSLVYLSVEGYHGYPTVNEMKELISANFDKYSSSAIDGIWQMSKPKNR